jgi:hypothetical protein
MHSIRPIPALRPLIRSKLFRFAVVHAISRPSRVERRRRMFRPMTSNVSTLSGIVANGHQTVHSVSSAPSKIPYGGFSPVRLQTRRQDAAFARESTRAYRHLQTPSGVHPLYCPVIWTCVPSERAGHQLRRSRPVALGSASGYAVRQPRRLL